MRCSIHARLASLFIPLLAGNALAQQDSNVETTDPEHQLIENVETADPGDPLTENVETVDPDDQVIEHIVVTGTRLRQGDPSARVDVITSEQIRVRGASSAEEIVRLIPQNFSAINGASNLSIDGVLDTNLGALGLGTSTVNLRGLGSRNTLVLLNGRRISGSGAGDGDFFTNLRDIPAASIDRIEVNLDGGSAVYGSDGLGGIINIIQKSDYSGGDIRVIQEFSSTNGDRLAVSGSYGHKWDSGAASINLSYTESDPVSSAKAGHVTSDYSGRFGGNQTYNLLDPNSGPYSSPAVRVGSGPNLVNPGISGTSYEPLDWRPATLADVVDGTTRRDTTGTTEDSSISVLFNQDLGYSFSVRAEMFYTESDTSARLVQISGRTPTVPASNAFNRFGQDVMVDYHVPEIATGEVREPFQSNNSEQLRYSMGFDWDINDKWRLVADYNNSTSKSSGEQIAFGVVTERRVADAFDESQRGILRALRDAQLSVLASSDPDVAVNLFGDGSAQNLDSLNLLMAQTAFESDESNLEEINIHTTGALWQLPAGELGVVVGYETRKQSLPVGAQSGLGLPEPELDYDAWFVEFLVPLVSDAAWARSVTMTLSARDDNYTSAGADGCADPVAGFFGCDNPNIVEKKFGKVSPRFGLSWVVNDEVTIRASRADGFRAPGFSDLFRVDTISFNFPTFDPLLGGFTPGPVPFELSSNIDLRPETSENLSLGVTYTPSWAEGLTIKLDYSELDYINRIANSDELRGLLPAETYGNLPEFFERNLSAVYPGTDINVLTRVLARPVNISRTLTETLDLDVAFRIEAGTGTWSPGLNISYVMDQLDSPTAGSEPVDRVGTTKGIDEYKIQGRLDWSRGRASAALFLNYTPSYDNTNFVDTFRGFDPVINPTGIPVHRIDSYLTVDVSFNYTWDNGFGLRAGARNLLNEDFPFALDVNGRPFDALRVDTRKRVAYLELKYAFNTN